MKVRFIRGCVADGQAYAQGDEAEISEKAAEYLTRSGFVEAVPASKPAAKKKSKAKKAKSDE